MKLVSNKQKLYLYAITPEFNGTILGAIGLDGGVVYSITLGLISALVSEVSGTLRPERRHLAAHQEVLKRLMANSTALLPVAFGVVAEGADAIHRILIHNQKSL